jgi:hypothetical protein
MERKKRKRRLGEDDLGLKSVKTFSLGGSDFLHRTLASVSVLGTGKQWFIKA